MRKNILNTVNFINAFIIINESNEFKNLLDTFISNHFNNFDRVLNEKQKFEEELQYITFTKSNIFATFIQTAFHNVLIAMCKKQIRNYNSLARYISEYDIYNELLTMVLENRVKMEFSSVKSVYSTLFYTVSNITKTEINRIKKQSQKMEFEQVIAIESYETYNLYDEEQEREIVEVETEISIIVGVKQYKKRSDVNMNIEKSIKSFEYTSTFKADIQNVLTDDQLLLMTLLNEGYTKKEINEMTGKRNDRTFQKIESLIENYLHS